MKFIALLALATSVFAGDLPSAPDAPAKETPAPAEKEPAAEEAATTVKPHQGWTADLEKALKQAKADNKMLLVEFTGSDWCPPCMLMREKVFSKPEFVAKASEKFILVEIDMPKGDKATAEKNQPTLRKYKVRSFPTIVLLDADGKEFARFGAAEHQEIAAFLARLDAEIEKKDLD